MLPLIAAAGGQIISGLVNGAMDIGFGALANKRQVKQQRRMNEVENEQTQYNMSKQLQMWHDTNYGAQKEEMKKAGLSPGMMYGMSGGGGQTAQISTGGHNTAENQGQQTQGAMGMGLQQIQQLALLKAQKENIEADTENKQVDTAKKAGIDTELGQSEKVIKDYSGKEAKDQYEKIKVPNRGSEAKTWENELEARQAHAETTNEMWAEGLLKAKSVEELESIMIQNAKGRAERQQIEKQMDLIQANTKGKNIENVILELEKELQQKTGLDKGSAGWMKALGRLLITKFGL